MNRNVLILGASYGSLFSTKLMMAGHQRSVGLYEGHGRLDQS